MKASEWFLVAATVVVFAALSYGVAANQPFDLRAQQSKSPPPRQPTPYCVDPFASRDMGDVVYSPCRLVPYRGRA